MHLKSIAFFGVITVFFSCADQQQSSKTNETDEETTSISCYRYIHTRDTVILRTTLINNIITGTLEYKFYEKDHNQGTIQGKMNGDILFADYSFNSEGMASRRPVAFKKIGKNFVEGYGETQNINGKEVFKNADSLDFSHSIVLQPYDCGKAIVHTTTP
jgi:hypothetical protein